MAKLFDYSQFDDDEPDNYDDGYEDLDSKKKKEEIRKLQIQNEVSLRNLVEKDMVKAIIARLGEAIQLHFVQMPRRESSNITAMLGIEGREKEIEKFLAEVIEKGISACKGEVDKAMKDETWD